MKFTKMHGLGNDFVMVDCFEEKLDDSKLPELAIAVCDRHFGIGADGLILVQPSRTANFRMRIFNSDGSEAETCGNGIRCFGKFVYEHRGFCDRDLSLELANGRVSQLKLNVSGGKVESVRVDMGAPSFARREIPVRGEGEEAVNEKLRVNGARLDVTCVSMGNPHCVTFVDDVERYPVTKEGPLVETHNAFPKRTNVEFVQVLSSSEMRVRVWERGAGETLACGSGACASLVASARLGKTGKKATVHLPGGSLFIEWSGDNRVYMTGPATEVFHGVWGA